MTTDNEALPPLPEILQRADLHFMGEGLAEAVIDYALTAAPSAQAEPQVPPRPAPLRGEQIVELARQRAPRTLGMLDVPEWVVQFARAIERAHGIGKQESK